VSITTSAGLTFIASVTDASPAQAVQAGIRRVSDLVYISALSTAGITETDQGDGSSTYRATRTTAEDLAPTDPVTGVAYQVVWLWPDTTTDVEDLVVLRNYVPALDEVAQFVSARIVDEGNNYLATWTGTTSPTDAQIETKIATAARDVRREVGPTLETSTDEDLIASARELAAMRAAMYVEASFYPEQANSDQSTYSLYKTLYDEGIASLKATVQGDPGDTQGFGSIAVASPTNAAYMDQQAGFNPWLPAA
jgi:hypothetical protein